MSCTLRGKVSTSLLVGIVSILFLIIIVMPNLLRHPDRWPESSAVGSIRTINTAETEYKDTYKRGYTCSLSALSDNWQNSQEKADASHARLIEPVLASGTKYDYSFALSGCEGAAPEHYKVVAVPRSPKWFESKSSLPIRAFCSDESGVIRFVPTASEDCLKNGVPLQ